MVSPCLRTRREGDVMCAAQRLVCSLRLWHKVWSHSLLIASCHRPSICRLPNA